MTLVEFLRARLDEEAALARRAEGLRRWEAITDASYGPQVRVGDGSDIGNSEPEWQRGTNVQVWQCDDEQDGCPEAARSWIAEAEHIARHDPARVLAEVDAKRRIVELHAPEWVWTGSAYEYGKCATCLLSQMAPCPTLRALAMPYAGHADYDPEWTV